MFKRITSASLARIAGIAALMGVVSAASAQDAYPTRPITLVIPYQAGGTTETFARVIIDDVAKLLGQPIVVHPKPGAAGTIGARSVADTAPDGYTLLANTSQHVMYDGMFKNLPFDPVKDFVPVGLLGSAPIIVVTSADAPYKTFKDVVAAAKTKNITYASGAQGSLPHLTGERVALQGKLDMTHVAFSGTAPALTNVMGGHVDLLYSTAASVMPQIYAGKLKALAVSSQKRMPELPNVPTIAEEMGLDNFDVTAWYAVWAPKGTNPKIIDAFNKAMREASATPAALERMKKFSVMPSQLTAQQFSAFALKERNTWLDVMKQANMQPSN
ncbi:tripartite tricarboxylate transporter substrate binding protein [Pusillimonas sp. TS35]|uniref:Bug family tripartite tricarboxylate transporter substrate binding protein n=1 Tax=Paracandidimonas lactea TaxID=2895524 RepID=UPI00136A9C56|nr:tripartite tricarboxylate transporter substrate binding protein [Paracandidimonas lactea]MYN14449.1 tripartite tricarboxylate transporter substrate binding protein [Pusillimonas sp. TS35]